MIITRDKYSGEVLKNCVYTFSYPKYQATPNVSLPAAESATADYTIVADSSNMTLISPAPEYVKHLMVITLAVYNKTANNTWIQYRIKKNGTEVLYHPGAWVPPGAYLTEEPFFECVSGDTFTITAWNADLATDFVFLGAYTLPSRIGFLPLGELMINTKIKVTKTPNYSLGNPYVVSTFVLYTPTIYGISSFGEINSLTDITFGVIPSTAEGYNLKTYTGEILTDKAWSNGAEYPKHINQIVPSEVSFMKVKGLKIV